MLYKELNLCTKYSCFTMLSQNSFGFAMFVRYYEDVQFVILYIKNTHHPDSIHLLNTVLLLENHKYKIRYLGFQSLD